MQRRRLDEDLVGGGVLAGVIDQGQLVPLGGDGVITSGQFAHHLGELGDVGPVAGIGVRDDRDPAVPRDDETEADQAEIGALLLCVTARRDRGAGGLPESMKVAKFVMSSTRPEQSRPKRSTITA